MPRGDRRVEHLDAHGGAVPRADADAARARLLHFRPLQMVFDVGQRLPFQVGIAEHLAVRGDQRDPRGHQLRQPVGLVIDVLIRGDRRIAREELGDELRLADEAHFDAGSFVLTALVGDDQREQGERRRGDTERRQKDLGAKTEAHVLT